MASTKKLTPGALKKHEFLSMALYQEKVSSEMLAKKIKVPVETVNEWIRGEREMEHSDLFKVSLALEIDPKLFFTYR